MSSIALLAPLVDASPVRVTALADLLRARGDLLPPNLPGNPGGFGTVPRLHFLSFFMLPRADDAAPQLGMEAHFDGSSHEFLLMLVEAEGALLRQAFSNCAGYPNGQPTRPELVDFLESREVVAEISYVGCPGISTEQVEEDARFARRVEECVRNLGQPEGRRLEHVLRIWRSLTPSERDYVRNTPQRPFWVRNQLLARPLTTLFSFARNLLIPVGAVVFGLVVLKLTGWLPPEALAQLLPPDNVVSRTLCWALGIFTFVTVVSVLLLWQLVHEFPRALRLSRVVYVASVKFGEIVIAALRAIPDAAVILGLIALLYWQGDFLAYWYIVALKVLLAAALVAGSFLLPLMAQIAAQEQTDGVDDMLWDRDRAERVGRREELGAQNHFVSITTIRPGVVRWVALWLWLQLVNLAARFLYNPHGLFNIASIHFARWQILRDGRLLFLTNYDGSFGGYLGEFATVGGGGVSGIWSHVVGFPRTFLIFFGGGARDEQRFKCYARTSQVETLLWYRRYPDLSVSAIERNAAIRADLQRFSLSLAAGSERMPEAALDAFLRRFSSPGP